MSRQSSLLHFQSEHAWFGDPMPLYAEGVYHIYYTARRGERVDAWGHISTKDFVSFTEHPMALTTDIGETGLCTGCVYYESGEYILFYSVRRDGKPYMMRAVSRDGIRFEKENRELFALNPDWYRPDGTWRDPCVYKDPEDGLYHMVFCARRPATAPDPFPGILGSAVSADLANWELMPPIETGHISGTMECPDLFRMGEQWALVYYWHDTRVRFSDSPRGPWRRVGTLSQNHFDFMAAKRMYDGQRHILVGWVPRKPCDCGERIWGGAMAVPREMYMDENGEPACRFIRETDAWFPSAAPELALENGRICDGTVDGNGDAFELMNGCVYWQDAPAVCRLRFEALPQDEYTVLTLFLRTAPNNGTDPFADGLNRGYQLIFDFPSRTLRLREQYQWDQRGDLAWIPLRTADGQPTKVDLILEGDVLEVTLNDKESLVYRLMRHCDGGGFALFTADGSVRLTNWRPQKT